MRKDYYCILGVSRSASKACLQRAFRQRARALHPDHAGPESAEAFIEAAEAYRVLSDREHRAKYDRETCACHSTPAPKPPVQPRRYPAAEPMLRNQPGWTSTRHKREAPPSPLPEVLISQHEAAEGTSLLLRISTVVPCPSCAGFRLMFFCPTCGGTGTNPAQRSVAVDLPRGIRDGTVVTLPLGSLGTPIAFVVRVRGVSTHF